MQISPIGVFISLFMFISVCRSSVSYKLFLSTPPPPLPLQPSSIQSITRFCHRALRVCLERQSKLLRASSSTPLCVLVAVLADRCVPHECQRDTAAEVGSPTVNLHFPLLSFFPSWTTLDASLTLSVNLGRVPTPRALHNLPSTNG